MIPEFAPHGRFCILSCQMQRTDFSLNLLNLLVLHLRGLCRTIHRMQPSLDPRPRPLSRRIFQLMEPEAVPNPNGLVHTILETYNVHRELIIRPGDVWTLEVIIARSSFFVNARAELLREHIVAHEDFALVARQETDFMPTQMVVSVPMNWIRPQFSTTTDAERNVYDIFMMATMKQCIRYTIERSSENPFRLNRGIPRVALLGDA
ncbi:hypothetical protein EDD22DRAFT_236573 [Suillus occidentalis]|nr:hypothetical protein EDD22DRAFT_236573 [Suillus occidentalis]